MLARSPSLSNLANVARYCEANSLCNLPHSVQQYEGGPQFVVPHLAKPELILAFYLLARLLLHFVELELETSGLLLLSFSIAPVLFVDLLGGNSDGEHDTDYRA